jgi:hypothetical protein
LVSYRIGRLSAVPPPPGGQLLRPIISTPGVARSAALNGITIVVEFTYWMA